MKYIVLVPDGMADYPLEELEGKTPLEISKVPNMTYFAETGKVGTVRTIPKQFSPGSDVANLSLLGYDPSEHYTGRAPIEAANMGINLADGEIAFRCNFVSEYQGKMADYSAGHISSDEAKVLIDFLNKKLGSEIVRFYPGVSYRHLLVVKTNHGAQELSALCVPPHDILGQSIQANFPKGPGDVFLRDLIIKAKNLLQNHDVNHIRLDLKENPANMIWLWGQGTMPKLIPFKEKYGVKGAIISAVDLIQGIGKLAGLSVIKVPGATGYLDTNYEGKGQYAVKALADHDFVFVHVEAPDEAGHEGKIKAKIHAIESFDYHIVGAVRRYCETHPETRVIITPDHATPIDLRTHTKDPVPFVISGRGIDADEILMYNERIAKLSSLKVDKGSDLMGLLINGK